MKPWFNFKNINSKDMGISIQKLPPRTKPEKRGEMITIPGRNGFLFESEDAYNGKKLELECTFLPPDNMTSAQMDELIMQILVWLDGDGELVFSDYPNYYYEAKVINEIPLERLFKRYRRFLLVFDVQPFAKSVTLTTRQLNVTGTSTVNVTSYYDVSPKMTLNARGNVSVGINGTVMNFKNLDKNIIIDTELMNCVDANGNNMNNYMVGDFPNLKVGNNTVTITKESSATFTSLKFEYRSLWLWLESTIRMKQTSRIMELES